MSDYGLFFGDGLELTGDRRVMRFLASGVTTQVNANLHRFEFRSERLDFAVYFQLLEAGKYSAQHVVHSVGNGVFHAYFVGSPCRVFVYEKKHGSGAGNYGVWLYNDNGNLALDSFDEPINPLTDLYIPPLGMGGKVFICNQAEADKTAFNMHCIRGRLAVNIWARQYCIWRDSMIRDVDGIWYVFGFDARWRDMQGDGSDVPANFYPQTPSRFNWLENTYPTSLGRIDVGNYL